MMLTISNNFCNLFSKTFFWSLMSGKKSMQLTMIKTFERWFAYHTSEIALRMPVRWALFMLFPVRTLLLLHQKIIAGNQLVRHRREMINSDRFALIKIFKTRIHYILQCKGIFFIQGIFYKRRIRKKEWNTCIGINEQQQIHFQQKAVKLC